MTLCIAALAVLGGAPAQEGTPCRTGRVGIGYRCEPCKRVLGPDDMRGGACKRCDEEPSKIEYCVKRLKPVFASDCRHKKKMALPFRCCNKVWRTPAFPEDTARLSYSCRACGAKADARADLKHKESCDNAFAVDRLCAKSGIAPHTD